MSVTDRALGQRLGVGIAVVERVGVAAVGVDGHRAVGAGDRRADIAAAPLTADTVLVSPVSTSVSLVSTLPIADAIARRTPCCPG